MSINEILKSHVKKWVVKKAKVTNPYGKELWYASVSIGYDYNASGTSIEKAYNQLTDDIFKSPYIMMQLSDIQSFREIVKSK